MIYKTCVADNRVSSLVMMLDISRVKEIRRYRKDCKVDTNTNILARPAVHSAYNCF